MIADGQPSFTAFTAAAARAAHLIVDTAPVIFADTLAEAMLGERANEYIAFHRAHGTHPILAGARAQATCRSRYAEDRLADSVGRGIGQYVLFGAGLDSFASRSPLAARVRVFEIDHPATQEWKRRVRPAPGSVTPAGSGRPAPGSVTPAGSGRPAPGSVTPAGSGRPAPGSVTPAGSGRPAPGSVTPAGSGRPAPGSVTPAGSGRPAPGSVTPAGSGRPAPGSVTYVPVDFGRDSLRDRLGQAGFDFARAAFVSWLGVTMYLERSAIEQTLSVAGSFAAGSEIVVDYMLPTGLRDEAGDYYAKQVGPASAERGEPWLSLFAPDDVAALLDRHGFGPVRHVRQRDMIPAAAWDRTDSLGPADLSRIAHTAVPAR